MTDFLKLMNLFQVSEFLKAKFHLCSCSRYVEAGILVPMYFRIMSCGPFVIIFSKIL